MWENSIEQMLVVNQVPDCVGIWYLPIALYVCGTLIAFVLIEFFLTRRLCLRIRKREIQNFDLHFSD